MKLAHVALASAGLIGISVAIAQTPSSNPCPGGSCTAVIVVPDGCGGGIVVAPDPIHIKEGVKATISWHVLSPDWTFDTKVGGINFSKHSKLTAKGDTKTYTVTIDSGPARVHKYDVNLLGKEGTCKRDPTIVNH